MQPNLAPAINDLVIRFANVNGTGSASANELFAKAVFRMGIPVTPKNIFPSNIQGLPTWFEVRVSESGYLGRRAGVDMLVAINPQSYAKDVAMVRPGGYFLYDNTAELAGAGKTLPEEHPRKDIHFLGLPMIGLCREHFKIDARSHLLLKNVIYVGALAAFFKMEIEVFKALIAEQFRKKEKLIPLNHQALDLGVQYVQEHFAEMLPAFPLRMERRDLIGDRILLSGNTACGLGALYAGATVLAWYPITPSTSVADAFGKYAKKLRTDPATGRSNVAIVQAEDELAAIGMVIGASWNGARAFTATSGPGVSLMNEFLGLAYFAEIPTVLIDVQRAGPSTGMPTRTQQSDILLAAYASHGDTKQVLLFPSTPTECFELTAQAFDLAERLQTPVIVMTDLDLGMNDHLTAPLSWDDTRVYDRGKVLSAEALEAMTTEFGRYLDTDGDAITYRTLPGTHPTKGSFFTRGTSRDEYARYTEDGEPYVRNMDRLVRKWQTAKDHVPAPEIYQEKNRSRDGMIFFGTSTYAALEALDQLAADGLPLDALRIRSLPFNESIRNFIAQHDRVYVVEQNRDAQMRTLLISELDINPLRLVPVLNYDGFPITAETIRKQVLPGLMARMGRGEGLVIELSE